jgi:6-phosphogluconolactonase (cycloisomerase 2 family)
MHKQTKILTIFVSFFVAASISAAPFSRPRPEPRGLRAGAVYVLTNQVINTVKVFARNANGTLNPDGEFSTGGAGAPVAQPQDPPVDPLASQGALILRNQFLFAVNAGSNQISVLRVRRAGLDLIDVVDSGGIRPISLTAYENFLYVLNEGGTPNITGFTIADDGTLTPLAGSTQPLTGGTAADPAQVSFNQDGTLLVVTEKAGNRIDTYTVDENGLPSAPINNPSNGMTPFGFAFNNDDFLIVSEAFGGTPNQAAASSYSAANDGTLNVISGSVHNNQTASCWVVINGKIAFVSNTANGTISSYSVNEDGTLTLLNATAANTGPTSAPRDMAMSTDRQTLFVQLDGGQTVASFRIGRNNGTLTLIDTDSGLPFGAQGIAAK